MPIRTTVTGPKHFVHESNLIFNHPCFSYSGMLVRGALAALDHNSNCGRGQAETKDGRTRLDLVKNRVGNKWFIRKVIGPERSHVERGHCLSRNKGWHP